MGIHMIIWMNLEAIIFQFYFVSKNGKSETVLQY
jgi:hypothetical protein